MATPEVLRREIKALAFDQYGTIVDMQRGPVSYTHLRAHET